MVTIKDVAQEAGVSVGSVSRVFNLHPAVGADTAAVVRQAAEKLGYIHPRIRRGQVESGSIALHRIGLLTLGMDRSLSRLPVIASLLEGASRRADEQGHSLVLCDIPDLDRVPKVLQERQLDGVLIKAALQGTAEQWARPAVRAATSIPHVWLMGRPNGCSGDRCGNDDVAIGRMAAEALAAQGHRRLAFLNPKPDHQLFQQRQAAFAWRARELGAEAIPLAPAAAPAVFPVRSVSSLDEVGSLIDRLLALPERPTGVFVPADSIAVLLYRALESRRLRVGRDVSVISCNHEPMLTEGLLPSLATLDLHAEEVGARGVDHLAWRAEHRDSAEMSITLAPTLVPGDSIRPLADGR